MRKNRFSRYQLFKLQEKRYHLSHKFIDIISMSNIN